MFSQRRRVVLSLSVPLISIGIAALAISFAPRIYRSQALLLSWPAAQGRAPTSVAAGAAFQQDGASELTTILDMLRSREIAEGVVGIVGAESITSGGFNNDETSTRGNSSWSLARLLSIDRLFFGLDPVGATESAIDELNTIRIGTDRGSNIVKVEYRTGSPELAQSVVDAWVITFLSKYAETTHPPSLVDFYNAQLSNVRQQRETSLVELQEAQTNAGIIAVADELAAIAKQITSARLRQSKLKSRLVAVAARTRNLEVLLSGIDSDDLSSPSSLETEIDVELQQELAELQTRERNLLAAYTPNHPLVQALKSRVKAASGLLREQAISGGQPPFEPGAVYARIHEAYFVEQVDQAALEAELTEVKASLTRLQDDWTRLSSHRDRIVALEQTVEMHGRRYLALSDRLDEARVEEQVRAHRMGVRVVQPATFEEQPMSPNKSLYAGLGIMAGLVGVILPWVIGRSTKQRTTPNVFSKSSQKSNCFAEPDPLETTPARRLLPR
jgi:uncharacterized protein involved in exopolysaccharide biosynthesis